MVATYTYDALGQRIGIDDSGTQTWTVYNGKSADANPYADFNSSGDASRCATSTAWRSTSSWRGPIPAATTSWYFTDQLGSVVGHRQHVGGPYIDQIIYDPFGNIVTQTNSSQRRSVHVRGDGI